MKPFRTLTGLVAPLDRSDVDTDQILPKQFMKLVQRTGFGQYLFYDWRFYPDGKPRPEFVLNKPEYKDAQILLTRSNFGCGSSREHAVWALLDYGFKAIIASSFADIFYNNCFKNGILPVVIPEEYIVHFFQTVATVNKLILTVDLQSQKILEAEGKETPFAIDPFRKKCLLEGLDDIELTLKHEKKILLYESKIDPYVRIPQ